MRILINALEKCNGETVIRKNEWTKNENGYE